MATPIVLTSCRIFAGGYDLTGHSNKLEFQAEVEDKDVTTFLPIADPDVGWRKTIGGLASSTFKGGGNWSSDGSTAVDDMAFAALGSVAPLSAFAVDANEGSLGYFTQTLTKSYQFLGATGDVASWTIDDQSAWPAVRGFSLQSPGTARTVTGTGTATQITAVPTGKQLYAALQVLSVSGTATPTLAVKVQSDNAVGFPSPADQITFTPATAIGGQISRVAGPIADDWFRVSFTISGTNPSFLFVVIAGISV
jgi:hypothetical protein